MAKRTLLNCFAFLLMACDPATGPVDDADRGPIGKADLAGSCEDACGGPSDGNCWCDEACHDFGDCCADKVDVCDGPACVGENPAGCVETGCDDGETCRTDGPECIPSACGCDEATGEWTCTADCGGGVCVADDDPPPACEGDNPAGCTADADCGEGMACSFEHDACISSGCDCDETTGLWNCTPDCNGGICVGEDDEEPPPACAGENPAEACSDDPSACIPSACFCDDVAGVWNCTPDCSGGQDC